MNMLARDMGGWKKQIDNDCVCHEEVFHFSYIQTTRAGRNTAAWTRSARELWVLKMQLCHTSEFRFGSCQTRVTTVTSCRSVENKGVLWTGAGCTLMEDDKRHEISYDSFYLYVKKQKHFRFATLSSRLNEDEFKNVFQLLFCVPWSCCCLQKRYSHSAF